jgi:hypothetical protein
VDDTAAEKIARNNALFREANDEISVAADDHGLDDGRPVPFICECSEPRCTQIIRLTLVEYRRVRSNPRWFAHALGHEEVIPGAVEQVDRNDRYVLVEKVGQAGEAAGQLAQNRKTD